MLLVADAIRRIYIKIGFSQITLEKNQAMSSLIIQKGEEEMIDQSHGINDIGSKHNLG